MQQVYCDLFHRTVDSEGMAVWPSLVDAGSARDQVAARIQASDPAREYDHFVVQEIYARLLHRPADAPGLAGWVSFLHTGGSMEQLAAAVAGSPEYFARSGGTADGFLEALYRDALGREIEPAGRAAHQLALSQGATPGQVATAIYGSDEYRTGRVRDLYRRLLGREADDAGLAAFVTALGRGLSDDELVAAFLGSPEYYRRATGSDPVPAAVDQLTPYVTALYQRVLSRTPDVPGLTGWVSFLQNGGSRDEIARAFWESAEHRGIQVDTFYVTYLGRPADAVGRSAWVSALVNGTSEIDVAAMFLSSAEYAAAHPDDAEFLDGLYADVLGRPGDPNGVAFWRGKLDGGADRTAVARDFLTSAEGYGRVVDDYYARFLDRAPDRTGVQTLLAALASAQRTQDQIAEGFLAAEEFFAKAARM